MNRSRSALLVLASMVGATAQVAAQNQAPPAISSRFIPVEIMTRLLERPEGMADSVSFGSSVDSVWVALKAGLTKLQLPIAFEDVGSRQMGHQGAKVFHDLGGKPLSSFLRCGSGTTGPNADTYMVYLTHLSVLRPLPDHRVALYSLVGGQAVDVAGGRNDPVNCTTTGRLEAEIAKQIGKNLGGGAPSK